MLRKINWRVLFGIAVSVIVLVLILKDVDLNQLAAELAQGNYWWVIPGTVIMIVAMWVRA